MKPLNQKQRKDSLMKFALAAFILLTIYGFSIYTFQNVKNGVNQNKNSDKSEMEALDHLFDKANDLMAKLESAESLAEKNKYALQINRVLVEEKPNFKIHKTLFYNIENLYLKNLENRENIASRYQDRILELEDELEKAQQASKDGGKDISVAKASIDRIANDIDAFGVDFANRDWCKVTGSKKTMKQSLKDKLKDFKNDILHQTSML